MSMKNLYEKTIEGGGTKNSMHKKKTKLKQKFTLNFAVIRTLPMSDLCCAEDKGCQLSKVFPGSIVLS